MAIAYIGNTISGIASDTKPTLSANEKGVIFIETDTNKIYQWDTDSWNEIVLSDASTSAKGIASFSSDNFAASSGAITIKDGGVILGTETTGNYVATVAGTSNEVNVSGSTGAVTIGLPDDVTIAQDLVVTRNLTVSGTTVTANVNNLTIEDPLLYLANGQASSPAFDSGFVVERGNTTNVAFIWDESADTFATANVPANEVGTTAGNVTIDSYANLRVATLTGDVTGNASTATALQNARTIGGTSFDGTANISVALASTATALANARTIGGTSFDGTANIAVALAATATTLATARTIGGTSFDGSANIVPATITVADTTDTTSFVALFESATGDLGPKTDAGITYNAGTGMLTATGFTGPLTGNVTGNITGTAPAGTLTGSTLASGVTASSLTSVGTLTSLTTTGDINLGDDDVIQIGAGQDLQLWHTGSYSIIKDNGTGALIIESNGTGIEFKKGGEHMAKFLTDGAVELYHDNAKKFETTATGVTLTGSMVIPADQEIKTTSGDLYISGYDGTFIRAYNTDTSSYSNRISWATYNGSMQINPGNATLDMQVTEMDFPASITFDVVGDVIINQGGNIVMSKASSFEQRLIVTGNDFPVFVLDSNRTSANASLGDISARWNGSNMAMIRFYTGDDNTNKDEGYMGFFTRDTSESITEKMRLEMDGSLKIHTDRSTDDGPRFKMQHNSSSLAVGDKLGRVQAYKADGTIMAEMRMDLEGNTSQGAISWHLRGGGGWGEYMRLTRDGVLEIHQQTTQPRMKLKVNDGEAFQMLDAGDSDNIRAGLGHNDGGGSYFYLKDEAEVDRVTLRAGYVSGSGSAMQVNIFRVPGASLEPALVLDSDSTANGGGAFMNFRRNGTRFAIIGASGAIKGSTEDWLGLYTESGRGMRFFTGAAYTDATATMNIHSGSPGAVGIGTDASGSTYNWSMLAVKKVADTVLSLDRVAANGSADNGPLLRFMAGGSEVANITNTNGTVSYGTFTGSHLALTNESIDLGMLVSMTGTNSRWHDEATAEIIYGVVKSTTANDSKILGTYLSVEEPKNAASVDNPHLIAAVGNGPMWVADKGANIAVGDYLISSDIAGHAMKDDGTYAVSYIIGRATENVDWNTVSDTVGSTKHKKITVTYESFKNLEGKITSLEARIAALES